MRAFRIGTLLLLGASLLLLSCFGARPNLRSYFVLHGEPVDRAKRGIKGLVRVRNMDAASIYEKFQIVVRRSPFELRYSDLNVWAVKPNQMVSDIIARTFAEAGTFNAVTRELGDSRPDYTLSGELNAIEIYDSNDLWYAHLSLSLRLTRFDTGERVWGMTYEDRKLVSTRTFSHAVRAIAELLQTASRQAIIELNMLPVKNARNTIEADQAQMVITSTKTEKKEPQPIFVPERGKKE